VKEKKYWRRYIYLWINFAFFEELVAKDFTRTRQVYEKCLELIPHKTFTFAKIWVMFAHFEIRRKDLAAARRILGTGLGKCVKKDKIFKGYIGCETQWVEFYRCRTLYQKFLQYSPTNCNAWKSFAEMEVNAQEFDRARGIFQLAIVQEELDMPEVVWKAFIDFEISQANADGVRALYSRLLQRTKHVKVWISHAQYESSIGEMDLARKVYAKADQHFKQATQAGGDPSNAKEERLLLLESWRDFEHANGGGAQEAEVAAKLPRRIKKKRQLQNADGSAAGWEEYHDYIFPDDEDKQANLKLLEMARRWKRQRTDETETEKPQEDAEAEAQEGMADEE